MRVRERPPLRVGIRAVTPNGREYRWAADERSPSNVPQGLSWSSTMPGGHEALDGQLKRKPGADYPDLAPFTTLIVEGAGGRVAGEFRLERAPRVSGDDMNIAPSAVGWQAALEDRKDVREVYVDRDMSHWRGPSRDRRMAWPGEITLYDPDLRQDTTTGTPVLELGFNAPWTAAWPVTEAWYDIGPGSEIGAIYTDWETVDPVSLLDALWQLKSRAANSDDALETDGIIVFADKMAGAGSFENDPEYSTLSGGRRFLWFWFERDASITSDERYAVFVKNLTVYGNQGLTRRTAGSDPGGYWASDVIDHAVGKYVPLLRRDIEESGYVISHLVFRDATTVGEIIRQANRFGLDDWAVWDDKTFCLYPRGSRGKSWQARVGPSKLVEAGWQVDKTWNSVIVTFQDVDGSTRMVGPIGSGMDYESADLSDDDPLNPATQAGLVRRDLLVVGTAVVDQAVQLGKRFLEESKLLNTSGQAELTGHVIDDHGVMHPYWAVRAGDTVSFIDAADTSPRRVVKASHNEDAKTCQVDLDSPPEALQALLERLGAELVTLGLS